MVGIVLLLWIMSYYQRLPPSRVHEITSHDIEFEASHISDPEEAAGFLPLAEAQRLCGAHRWRGFNGRTRQPRRKIYDLLMINNEMDWLEIRMETMARHVDYFVILESVVKFTGLQKSLMLKDNWDRFARFHKQMIYQVVKNPPIGAPRTWDYEDHQRNAMFLQVIPGLEGEKAAQIGDVILVSDVDEIFLHQGPEWGHPQATTFQGTPDTILPANLRNGEGGSWIIGWWQKTDLWNAGWHCSSCFATIEDVLTKMKSFSHVPLNSEPFRDRARIVDRVSEGLDLWDREGENYKKISRNEDIPEILKSQKERFKYLLDRGGSNAGFTDYQPEGDGAVQGA